MSDHPQPPPGDEPPQNAEPPRNAGPPENTGPPGNPPTPQFPPVNYAPPGYTPDYGYRHPPPYGAGDYPGPPPGYPGYPPQPAPRRSNVPLIAVIVAVALLLCGGVATTGLLVAHNIKTRAHRALDPLTEPTVPTLPTDVPNLPGLPTDLPTDGGGLGGQQITVTYQVTGDGPAEVLYIDKLGSAPTELSEVKLPWSFSTTMQTPALVSIIAMRAGTSDGQVTCRALVDGKEVKKATSDTTAFATAACSYFALD